MFRDVPRGMFRNVAGSSMFRVLSTPFCASRSLVTTSSMTRSQVFFRIPQSVLLGTVEMVN